MSILGMPCSVVREKSLSPKGYDGYILIAENINAVKSNKSPSLDVFSEALESQLSVDQSVAKEGATVKVPGDISRLIYAPTGPLGRDYDDVRRFFDAGVSGVTRALKAGVKAPLLVVVESGKFKHESLIALLGTLHALYVPIEIREDVPQKKQKVNQFGCLLDDETIQLATALEKGRTVARDIGGSDPERMAPPRVEKYVREVFSGSKVTIDVVSDYDTLCKEYPLFSAVNRCAAGVTRHQGRVIYLTYQGSGPIEKTLLLVGKGVTYDTGGADIKAGGVMAGMHRDKCGSAAVAGFMKIINELQPPNVKVIAGMAMVRNSVGSECYVADELITSRAGVRIRVGNTDAEGRMAMADVLCYMKEKAANEVDPHLMTIATLTGHCCLAFGDSYTAIMENGPAASVNLADRVKEAGNTVADPFEISTIRREDYEFHMGPSEYEDVLQCNNLPSSKTPRGHQTPSAFLIMAAGLDKHGKDSAKPLKYAHLDIAGSAGPFPGVPTGAPILALTKTFLPEKFNSNLKRI